MKLLLVEDDAIMRSVLERTLGRRGILIEACGDGLAALEKWRAMSFDVILLDLTLPGLDGLQVLAQARQSGLNTPVLIATARGTVGDRIMGLNLGADDYLPKPFDLDELEARLRALVRRRPAKADKTDETADFGETRLGGLRYEKSSGAIYHAGQAMELTPRELALLQALMLKPGHAVAKEKLFDIVFPGQTDVQYEAIEVVVYRLRKKLQSCGVTLMTLRGLGYLIKANA
ncbi:MAG: response regulator [Polaromonas sp.]|nr:response regulator [Polaromonas sp.]